MITITPLSGSGSRLSLPYTSPLQLRFNSPQTLRLYRTFPLSPSPLFPSSRFTPTIYPSSLLSSQQTTTQTQDQICIRKKTNLSRTQHPIRKKKQTKRKHQRIRAMRKTDKKALRPWCGVVCCAVGLGTSSQPRRTTPHHVMPLRRTRCTR